MSLNEIAFLLYINTTPLFLIVFGCYVLYLFVSYETKRLNEKD